jgi:hypothetical protein
LIESSQEWIDAREANRWVFGKKVQQAFLLDFGKSAWEHHWDLGV